MIAVPSVGRSGSICLPCRCRNRDLSDRTCMGPSDEAGKESLGDPRLRSSITVSHLRGSAPTILVLTKKHDSTCCNAAHQSLAISDKHRTSLRSCHERGLHTDRTVLFCDLSDHSLLADLHAIGQHWSARHDDFRRIDH